jgi:hypothetical protein
MAALWIQIMTCDNHTKFDWLKPAGEFQNNQCALQYYRFFWIVLFWLPLRYYLRYLLYLCLFVYSGVQHILCCVSASFFFVLYTLYMLPVPLDCPVLIAPSVFCNVYLLTGRLYIPTTMMISAGEFVLHKYIFLTANTIN